jgi:formylglycine-generating enzyme required for sulfatase activity
MKLSRFVHRRGIIASCLSAVVLMSVGATERSAGKDYTESIPGTVVTFDMVHVPGGKFKTAAGSEVEVKPFWIEKHETTWDEFDIYCYQLDLTDKEKAEGVDAKARPSKPYGAPDFGFGHAKYPALAATYHSAVMYCEWLSKKTGKQYRLPTEAEWEFAATAGGADPGPKGDELDDYAWYWDNSDDKTHAVMKKKPNAWGLYDMLGNALEWCTAAEGKGVGRGGAWDDKPEDVTAGKRREQDRTWNSTDPQQPKSRWWLSDGKFIGFRVVREDK